MNAPADIKAETKPLTFDEWFDKWKGRDEHVELIDGEEIFLPFEGPFHTVFVSTSFFVVAQAIKAAGLWGDFRVYANPVLKLSERSALIPDVGVFRAGVLEAGIFGSPESIVLAIETADTSLSYDQGRKSRACARHGVQELWVKRVKTRDVRVRRTVKDGAFVEDFVRTSGDVLHPLFAPELSIAVDDLFDLS